MPAKVVYGKRKTTTQTTTSFSSFISPEKTAVVTQAKANRNTAQEAKAGWRQQLELAAEQRPGEDDVAALAAGLGGLRLELTQPKEVVETKRKGRPREEACQRNSVDTKENKAESGGDVKSEAVAAPVVRNASGAAKDKERAQARRGGQRKALEARNANGEVCTTCQPIEKDPGGSTIAPPCTPTRSHRYQPHVKSTSVCTPPRPQLPTPEPTPGPEDPYSVYASPLLELSFGRRMVPFEQWSSQLEPHFEITKIAEASFSEVYRLSTLCPTTATNQESVLKVVALKTPPDAPLPCQLQVRSVRDREGQAAKEMAERADNDQWKSEVADVLSEVKLLQNLNDIPGFTNFRDLTILQGRPSQSFASAWNAWNKARPRGKKSEFPDPSKKSSYDDLQLWAVVEMQDAGTDCEKIMEGGGLCSIWEVWDVFWGVCLSVAKAEETCRFEHRDLHMGNICVRSSRTGASVKNIVVKDPTRRKFRFTGLETTVIDYTLSRADILTSTSQWSSPSSLSASTASSNATEQDVAYLDLDKDSALFEGDASEEYQYEIYRYMRGAALYGNPMQNAPIEYPTPRRSPRKNTHIRFDEQDTARRSPHKSTVPDLTNSTPSNVWRQFHPKTNLVWVHFLLHKLLSHLSKLSSTPDRLSTTQMMAIVEGADDPVKVKKKALKLHNILKHRVSELLCPVALGKKDSLGSVKELVVLALEERWLRVGDVAR
jgi:serine/threonine-protein kinase haspin